MQRHSAWRHWVDPGPWSCSPAVQWAMCSAPTTLLNPHSSTDLATPMEYRTLVVAPAAAWTHVAVTSSGRGSGDDILIYVNGTLVPHSVQHSKANIEHRQWNALE